MVDALGGHLGNYAHPDTGDIGFAGYEVGGGQVTNREREQSPRSRTDWSPQPPSADLSTRRPKGLRSARPPGEQAELFDLQP